MTGSAMTAATSSLATTRLEGVFEMAGTVEIARRIFQVVRAAIAVGEWNAVDLAGEGSESGFVGCEFC